MARLAGSLYLSGLTIDNRVSGRRPAQACGISPRPSGNVNEIQAVGDRRYTDIARSRPTARLDPRYTRCKLPRFVRGRNSVVECSLPKADVEGSNPFARLSKEPRPTPGRGPSFVWRATQAASVLVLDHGQLLLK